MFSYQLEHTDHGARAGTLQTSRGTIQTPIFMPVGTQGSVKTLSPHDLDDCGAQIILGNTYHLMLRPGEDLVNKMGGLHKFISWNKPILTDSGGFQVFSLAETSARQKSDPKGLPKNLVEIDDEGVTFRSYLDGRKIRMTPEVSMEIQRKLGSDIIMAFDQCPPGKSTRDAVGKAMEKTTHWLKRCHDYLDRHADPEKQTLFGIIQGGIYTDLREAHAQSICELPLKGFAIGGLSVGEAKQDMWPALEATTKNMPANKPRYLMGVGTPMDLLEGIARGVDMFDCVMPTRNARNGTLFTSQGKVTIKRAEYKMDESTLDEACSCYTCNNFSRAYLRHLFMANELLFCRLASLHNIHFYMNLVKNARKAILENRFVQFFNSQKDTVAK